MNDQWITRAIQLLRKLEFSGTQVNYGDLWDQIRGLPNEYSCCPCCGGDGEHDDDCELHKLLEEAKK